MERYGWNEWRCDLSCRNWRRRLARSWGNPMAKLMVAVRDAGVLRMVQTVGGMILGKGVTGSGNQASIDCQATTRDNKPWRSAPVTRH